MHNKDWIPVSSTGMTLQGHWDDTLLNRHTAIHLRYLSR
nr:WPE palindromic element domain-containing protein [Wolbachia endosymbiont (group A) of Bibio marci]